MPFIARTGAIFNASGGGLFNMMPTRTGFRSLLSLTVFFALFVFAYAAFEFPDGPPDGRIAWEFQKLGDDELRSQEASQRSFAVRSSPAFCLPAHLLYPERRYITIAGLVSWITLTIR